jgi:hypothetical protein
MKKLTFLLPIILVLSFALTAYSQEPGITWTKLYKPVSSLGTPTMAQANDGLQLTDGGYLAVGVAANPWLKGYLVRTNSLGDTIWTKQFFNDVTNYGSFTCTDVELANDGNYFLAGYGTHGTTPGVVWILKVNTSGELLWSQYFQNQPEDFVFVTHDMKVTPDGGVVITGDVGYELISYSDAFILKYNADGVFQWYHKFGGPANIDEGFSVENAWNGGYLLSCLYDSIGISQLRLIKTNASGEYEWSVIYMTMPENINDWPCIIRTADNKYVISGEDLGEVFLMKIEQDGSVIWYHTYGFTESQETAFWVDQTSDGGFAIACAHTPVGETEPMIFVVKTNSSGDATDWTKLIDVHFNDRAVRIRQTADDGYILFGYTRTDPDGLDFLMMMKLGGTNDIEQLQDNGLVLRQNYPNPFKNTTFIHYSLPSTLWVSLKVYDIQGKEVAVIADKEQSSGNYSLTFDGSILPAGPYYYQLKAGQVSQTRKMIIIK